MYHSLDAVADDTAAIVPPLDVIDRFARMQHAASLRQEASRCRRLANSIGGSHEQDKLFALARDFEQQADWIDPLT